MAEESIESLVDAGKASPGPPLGPALGPLGVNAKVVVDEINEKTKAFSGMKVPVKVTVDTETKKFTISIGSPPTASLLKKDAGIEKGTGDNQYAADVGFGTILDIAKMKQDSMLAGDLKAAVKEVIGTCVTLGIKIEGKTPEEATASVDSGEYDDYILGKKEASHEHTKLEVIEKPAEEEEAPEGEAAEGEATEGEAAEGEVGDDKKGSPDAADAGGKKK